MSVFLMQAGAGARHLIHWMLSFLPEERPSIPVIRTHVWMKRKCQSSPEAWSRRRAKRQNAPVAEKLDQLSTFSSTEKTILEPEYERLGENSQEAGSNSKQQPFWRNIFEKVKLKKSASFHFLPNSLRAFKNKVIVKNSLSKEDQLREVLEKIIKNLPSDEESWAGKFLINSIITYKVWFLTHWVG